MDPNMDFVKFFGKNNDVEALTDGIIKEIKQYKKVKAWWYPAYLLENLGKYIEEQFWFYQYLFLSSSFLWVRQDR